jgi:ERCC4-type nuclease
MKPDVSLTLRPRSELAQLDIVVDTREQRPWHFPPEIVSVRRGTLDYGDYALSGDVWAIERKSLDDFVGTVCANWERFCRELERMPPLPQRTIIVEGSIACIIAGEFNAGVHFKFVMRRIAQLTLMGVSVLFCDNELHAALMAYRLFRVRAAFLANVEEAAESAE